MYIFYHGKSTCVKHFARPIFPLFFDYSVIFFVSAHRRHSGDTAATPPCSAILSPPHRKSPRTAASWPTPLFIFILAIRVKLCYSETNRMDDDKVKQDFHEFYQQMNGMSLQEMDKIIYPVCALCHDHQRSGFIHGVQVGIRLAEELK